MTTTRIRVPATSANLGPGFDTLGMALQFYNHFEATPAEALSVSVSPHTCVDVAGMALDPAENLLSQAYTAYFNFRDCPVVPAALSVEAHIPLSRGLGSSSTAIVGGLMLADNLHEVPLGKAALLPWAVELEGHPDNVTPALLGGVHCCLTDGLGFQLAWPAGWGILMVIPPTPLSTHEARRVMPSHYPQGEVVTTLRGMGAWVGGVMQGDAALFRHALASDRIHEPARGALIPEFSVLKQCLAGTEALGSIISGAGSTMAVFTPDTTVHQQVKALLKGAPALSHCRVISVKPDKEGAQVVRPGSPVPGTPQDI